MLSAQNIQTKQQLLKELVSKRSSIKCHFPGGTVQEIYDDIIAVDLDNVLINDTTPIPGASQFVRDLTKRDVVMICTNATRQYAEERLGILGLNLPIVSRDEIESWQENSPWLDGEVFVLLDDGARTSFGVAAKLQALNCRNHIQVRHWDAGFSWDKLFSQIA